MEIKVIDSIDELMLYKVEWDSILKEINNDILFLEPDWILFWWKFFGDKHDLFVLIVFNDEEIAGICPLMITNKAIYNEIRFIGNRESSSNDFILRDKYREEAFECICNFLRNLEGKNIIAFDVISEQSANYALLNKYLKVNKVPFVSKEVICYFLNLKDNSFKDHFEDRFGKKTRQTMNGKEKKLKNLGNLAYKRVVTSDEIDEVFEIHEKRWLRKIGNSSFSKGGTKEFYKELALNKNMKFNINVDAIKLNNRIISFMYGFEYNSKYLSLRIAHDDDFYFLSPGELVFKKKIEECFSSQIGVFDFGLGYEPYKAKWTDDYKRAYNTIMPSDNLLSRLIFYIKFWTRIKLIIALKKNKRIYNFKKYYLGKIKYFFTSKNISDKITRIKRAVERDGLLSIIAKSFITSTGKIFSHKQYLILEKNIEIVELPQSNMQVKEAEMDDLDALSKAMNESPSSIVRRFINKYKCYITLHDGKIIHYCWIDCSSIEISNIKLNILFGKSEVHIYEAFVEKKYKNNYEYILSNVFNLLYRNSFRKCYITVNSSEKSFENEIYKKIFHPRYKVFEKRLLNTVKHNIVELK